MIAPVFDEIPAYEQAFSPNLRFFQHPQVDLGSDLSARARPTGKSKEPGLTISAAFPRQERNPGQRENQKSRIEIHNPACEKHRSRVRLRNPAH
jgi:hypothetical protein